MRHYTYVLWDEWTGEYYIGVRSCYGDPKDDDYQGSMKTWKLTEERKKKLNKRILGEYISREEAEEAEAMIISEYILDPNNRNYYCPGEGYVAPWEKY